jgi:hypothetical protein
MLYRVTPRIVASQPGRPSSSFMYRLTRSRPSAIIPGMKQLGVLLAALAIAFETGARTVAHIGSDLVWFLHTGVVQVSEIAAPRIAEWAKSYPENKAVSVFCTAIENLVGAEVERQIDTKVARLQSTLVYVQRNPRFAYRYLTTCARR